jgi:hypothetical protein
MFRNGHADHTFANLNYFVIFERFILITSKLLIKL